MPPNSHTNLDLIESLRKLAEAQGKTIQKLSEEVNRLRDRVTELEDPHRLYKD